MQAAVGLYTDLGFVPVAPYVFNPLPGALFLGRALSPGALSPGQRAARSDRPD